MQIDERQPPVSARNVPQRALSPETVEFRTFFPANLPLLANSLFGVLWGQDRKTLDGRAVLALCQFAAMARMPKRPGVRYEVRVCKTRNRNASY